MLNYTQASFMKHVYFPVIIMAMAYPNEWAVAEL